LNLRKIIIFFIFFAVCFSVFPQEKQDDIIDDDNEIIIDEILQDDIYTEQSIFIINSFNYNVKGRTLPFVLNTNTE
jgi:phosphatidylglycerophosphatase A